MARKAQDQLAESGTIVQETFQGISIVKAFTSEFYEINRYVKKHLCGGGYSNYKCQVSGSFCVIYDF